MPRHSEQSVPARTRPAHHAAAAAALAVLVLWVYAPVYGFDFVNLDDPVYVTANPMVQKGLSWKSVQWAFTTLHAHIWHPVTWLSHLADVSLFGMDPGGHHAVSAGIHLFNTLLVYLAFFLLLGRPAPALLAAALFGVHPLHVESAAWVSERKELLSFFFALSALCGYALWAKSGRRAWYGASLGLFVLSLMAKPMAVTLPLVLLLADAWPLDRLFPRPRRTLLEKIPFFVLAAISAAAALAVQRHVGLAKSMAVVPALDRLENVLVSSAGYVGKALVPVHLAAFYPYQEPGAAMVAVSALVVLGVSAAAVALRKKAPWLAVGWAWYLVALFPVSGVVPIGSHLFADRYTYFPLLGVFLALSMGTARVAAARPGLRRPAWAAAAACVVLFAVAARAQVNTWKNSVTLFSHALDVTQDNWLAHDNLGSALMDQGETDQAIPHFRRAADLAPHYFKPANNLGLALARKGRYAQAIPWLAKAVELAPDSWQARANLGEALLKAGKAKEAVKHLAAARKLNPDQPSVAASLGHALLLAGRYEEAREHLSWAMDKLGESPGLLNSVGASYLAQGDRNRAAALFRRALALDPGYQPALDNLEAAGKSPGN
ncbi:MAG: tetratricopeptide repeat protein [Deltaproteobacteria bacterium]|nr:tetratricopeptide repeat protein [Deltaproteobacteria bacterium]